MTLKTPESLVVIKKPQNLLFCFLPCNKILSCVVPLQAFDFSSVFKLLLFEANGFWWVWRLRFSSGLGTLPFNFFATKIKTAAQYKPQIWQLFKQLWFLQSNAPLSKTHYLDWNVSKTRDSIFLHKSAWMAPDTASISCKLSAASFALDAWMPLENKKW